MNARRWLLVAVFAGLVMFVGGPWAYIHLIRGEAPAPLSIGASTQSPTSASVPSDATAGSWKVTEGSQVGYRVDEVLFGQNTTAVGRTDAVTGTLQVSGTTIRAATFTVDMTTVRSDESRRDNQFNGRVMETATYPTATFELSDPIVFYGVPADGTEVSKTIVGKMTLHGVTKTVTFQVSGRMTDGLIQVSGSVPITFTDYNIANPSFGPAQTEDHGLLEFALNFARG